MTPDFLYKDEEGVSICQLNGKGYALIHFVDGMFDEETSLASFKAAGGTDEGWLRLLAELAEPELKLDPHFPADYLARIQTQEILNRIFPIDAELKTEGNKP